MYHGFFKALMGSGLALLLSGCGRPDVAKRPAPETTPPPGEPQPPTPLPPPQPTPPEPEAQPAVEPDPIAEGVNRMLEQRRKLDETVWAHEQEAQTYEKYFVELWDELRKQSDTYLVLKKFSLEKILLGRYVGDRVLAHGIDKHVSEGVGETFDFKTWLAWADRLFQSGFRLVQSEWHHKQFMPPGDGPAKSVIRVVLHLTGQGGAGRYIVEGDLDVTWKTSGRQPDTIDASDLVIYKRAGGPVFRKVFERTFRSWQDDRLNPLVYDLDGDGLAEIVLPAENVLLKSRGGGLFGEEKISSRMLNGVRAGVIADFDGDLVPDLMCAGNLVGVERRTLAVFKGTRDGRFAEEPELVSVNTPDIQLSSHLLITPGDVDRDGDLDLWISQYKPPYVGGAMPTPYYDANDGVPSYLLIRNSADKVFEDRTDETELGLKRFRRTYSSSFVDLDDDGDLDLLVVSDFSGVDVYHNDGSGQFSDVTDTVIDNRALFGMGHAFGDFNADGRLDIYVTGMSSTTARRLDLLGLG
ncbi:MAG: VCBS repeat-containing protein, partial [Verrucomicrobiota bacterium]